MVFVLLNVGFFVKITSAIPISTPDPSKYVIFDGEFDWDDTVINKSESDDYYSYTEFRSEVCTATANASACDTTKIIRFDSAEELYRFSVDVSFEEVYITGNPTEDVKLSDEKIDILLSLHYVLGQDIDYSVMKSKTFIPIGYLFGDTTGQIYRRYFKGTFDGQGYEIKNLYMSGFQYLIYEDKTNPLNVVDIAMSEYYAMFNYNAGVIKNIGFIDVYSEFLGMHPDLLKLASIVGFNMPDPETWDEIEEDFEIFGSVENIYVIDTRTNVREAGLRYLVGTASDDFQAAGIIHTNSANFVNSYYVSKVVVSASFISKFEVQPVLFQNQGEVIINLGEVNQTSVLVEGYHEKLYYDSDVYLLEVDTNNDGVDDYTVHSIAKPINDYANGVSTENLKNGSFSYESGTFYFYPDDGYPILKGLAYNNGVYEISNAVELAFFSRLLDKNTILYGTPFNYSDFVLTNDIDMSVLAPGVYKVPSKTFYGTFSGANGDEDVLTDNFYIYGLVINNNYSVSNEHFSGLFSRLGSGAIVSDLNFTQSTIQFVNTNKIYSNTFYMGAIAGRMVGATVQNILLDVDFDLGEEAISRTYLGSVAGMASGIIRRVSNLGDISFGTHSFTSAQAVNPKYYIGGIVGATQLVSPLKLYEVNNSGDIYGFATTSDIIPASGVSDINVYIGGIIGSIFNTEVAIHDLVEVANKGNIYPGAVKERTELQAYQYIGGVFGILEGFAPILEDVTGFRFANLYNEGDVFAAYADSTADIKSAGIGISNTTENTEYALLFNHGTFDYDIQDMNLTSPPYSTNLIISEYGRGSSSNRYIEIYNGTGQSVSLTGYTLARYLNGETTTSRIITLSGTIADGATYVVADSSAAAALRNLANTTSTSSMMDYDGNDAVVLRYDGVPIDTFGIIGDNPGSGWTVDGVTNATVNRTIVRKKDSVNPTTNWNPADWTVYPTDTWTYVNNHVANHSFKHTATIMDVSNNSNFDKLTLTRVYNYANFEYDSKIFSELSPFVYSLYENEILIRFSENYGDINYMADNGNTKIYARSTINISAITNNINVDYLNFHNYGDINVVNLDLSSHQLFISGFSKVLSTDRFIRNSLNDGNITFAEISGSGNIYVAGFVNINYAGDLHESFQSSTQPIANEGIINSINSGNISTAYGEETSGLYGILGTNNTFIGGVTTLNAGSIQDTSNLGDISAYNSNTNAYFYANTSSTYAGLVYGYDSGIVAGGIAAIAIKGTSRIYDTANNGNVIAIAEKYVRSGGVLGVSLWREADAGGITSLIGLEDNIQNSILSNGLNFGSVSAISSVIAEYTPTPLNTSFVLRYGSGTSYSTTRAATYYISTVNGNSERPPIYSSAGGVIGYGLSVMQRMLNHGTISATDVAGGVVGATYVLGSSTTYVNITTAINYGLIKSIDFDDFDSIDKFSPDIEEISTYYMADGNTFIYPTHANSLSPGAKRGFGGIFGRLQRGTDGIMTSEGSNAAFNFIVNANDQIDLIGRLDQVDNFSSSLRYFRFNNAIYYSAKEDDNTQAVFTGIYFLIDIITSRQSISGGYSYTYSQVVFKQVGIVMSEYETLSTGNTFNSSTYFAVGAYYNVNYYDQIEVPWITEDPNDSNLTEDWTDPLLEDAEREYIYGPYFPMRTNINLTEYIYFAEYNLLADRFRNVVDGGTGENVRENGMYVLSTTAGQQFGAVLPRNINLSAMKTINEDLDLSIINLDYNNLAPEQTLNLNQSIIDKYEDLYQTRYNDKAELTNSPFQNLTLKENDGSDTILSLGNIDYINREITFTISMEAFNFSNYTNFDPVTGRPIASFRVFNAITSASSLIAIRPDDYFSGSPTQTDLEDLSGYLFAERYDQISTDYPAELDIILPVYNISSNTTLSLGYFSVFSEAFINDPIFADAFYYNDYQVYITFTPNASQTSGTIGIQSVSFNGGGNVTLGSYTNPQPLAIDIRSNGDVNYNGSLRLNFNDGKGILNQGYDFKDYFKLYYMDGTNEVEVHNDYYSVTSVPVNSSGIYQITFNFNNAMLKFGDYKIKYSYFAASTVYEVLFDKAASNQAVISNLNYYSMDNSLSISGTTITSLINLGKIPNIDASANNYTAKTLGTSDPNYAVYLSITTYDISFMYSDSFVISSFANITSARLVNTTNSGGYITYVIEYIVVAENGSTTNTYTHSITERTTDVIAVNKDGNDVPINEINTTREATNTQFGIDLGFDQSSNMSGPVLYSINPLDPAYLSISVTGVDPDNNPYLPEEIVGLTYIGSNLLYINMSNLTLPGTYTFTITYHRSIGNLSFTSFEIEKFEGVNAYLEDIKFTAIATESKYPEIDITNSVGGSVVQIYNPSIYFYGIDYDGADENEWQYFKIKGQVSNIPLEAYYPYMLDYLPLGATIAKYDPLNEDFAANGYWSPEVDINSTEQEKSILAADYTQAGSNDENIAIQYRINSEDGQSQVYYFITVNDILYNLTLIFDIYYCDDEDVCVLANTTSEFNEIIQIKAYNLDIFNKDVTYTTPLPDENNPLYYPVFTSVSGLYNTMSQFIYTADNDYSYRFGRNRSGFYIYEVVLPVDQYLNEMYTYEIEFGEYTLNDINDLDPFTSSVELNGKYFYISYSEANRTRRFNIYIRKAEVDGSKPFGLFDFLRTWS